MLSVLVPSSNSDMVGVAQWLERLAVAQEVAGSNPVSHPNSRQRIAPARIGAPWLLCPSMTVAKLWGQGSESTLPHIFDCPSQTEAISGGDR